MTLAERKAAWKQKSVAKVLAKAPERSPEFKTSSAIPVERVYTPDREAELCPQLGISIPVGKDSLSMRTQWDGSKVTSPVSLIVSAFATLSDSV